MCSIAAALEMGRSDAERLLVRVAAGVYRERLVIRRPVEIVAHPAVRHFSEHSSAFPAHYLVLLQPRQEEVPELWVSPTQLLALS